MVVFIPPRKAPVGILRKASETASRMLEGGLADPIDHSVFTSYFSELYWKANSLDSKDIIKLLTPDTAECGIQFRSAAEAFQMIDDSMQQPILVPYGEGEKLIGELKALGPERWLLRKLQRYAVNIYTNQFTDLRDRGSIEEVSPGIWVLTCSIEYDATVGLLVDEMPRDPAAYMG
jgi:CRISPR-associated endonuclease/helicase Cas3